MHPDTAIAAPCPWLRQQMGLGPGRTELEWTDAAGRLVAFAGAQPSTGGIPLFIEETALRQHLVTAGCDLVLWLFMSKHMIGGSLSAANFEGELQARAVVRLSELEAPPRWQVDYIPPR